MVQMSRRKVLESFCASAAGLALGQSAYAQPFPARPVTLLVPYPAGGTSDQIARAITPALTKALGQPVIVENLGGATGAVAARKLLNAPADGYSVFVGSPNELILGPLANASAPFKSEDFRMVQKLGDLTLAALGRGDLPASNMDQLVAYAKRRANEGNPLTFGSTGPGSIYHLLGEQMAKLIGVPMIHVPYRGGGPMQIDLLAGRIDLYLGGMGTVYTGSVASGKLKMLGMISSSRLDTFKDIPLVRETKGFKDYEYGLWLGLQVRKETPEPIVDVLRKTVVTAMSDPAYIRAAEASQVIVSTQQTSTQANEVYSASIAQYGAIAKSINLQPQ
ncbi:MAG: tripartite tricarboxylate transporter substrate binding protein [Proteobacteria bacterium]|nr:tripartite tricarboxylate transporter substrate binding protein [Pseudomonadota bacterium]MBS0494733.1 tripartite tricarboxylate transporter substrate binding protein [Pseudomonadota bacterium]